MISIACKCETALTCTLFMILLYALTCSLPGQLINIRSSTYHAVVSDLLSYLITATASPVMHSSPLLPKQVVAKVTFARAIAVICTQAFTLQLACREDGFKTPGGLSCKLRSSGSRILHNLHCCPTSAGCWKFKCCLAYIAPGKCLAIKAGKREAHSSPGKTGPSKPTPSRKK